MGLYYVPMRILLPPLEIAPLQFQMLYNYKKPMCGAEVSRLYQLLVQRLSSPFICYPHDVQRLGSVELFVFQRCRPPPDISFIRYCMY